jgi:hypothetical protein
MPDIATRLRQTRANMIGTDDEQHYWDCYDAAAAIERLRLTDEEREAISRVYDLLCDRSRELQSATRLDEARPLIQWAKTLQGLWERLSGSAAISGAGKSAPAANTPPEPSPVCAGSHVALHRVVRALLDGVNARYAKNPREWTCPHMQTLDDMTQSEPQPTLTDEEREAIAYGVMLCEATAGCANERATIDGASRAADVLRGLLERNGAVDGRETVR